MKRSRSCLPAAAILLLAQMAGGALADVHTLPLPVAAGEAVPALQPRGHGTFRWFGLHVYDAVLWLPAATTASADTDHPLALRLRYARSFKGGDIAQRSIDEIARLELGEASQRARWLETMRKLFPDVTRGSTLTGLRLPGRGVRFFHDQQHIGDVADESFARAFFAIWLDARTSAPALREALLGSGAR